MDPCFFEHPDPHSLYPVSRRDAVMNFDDLIQTFWKRPVYQRLFLAFTVGLFLSCAARMAGAAPAPETFRGSSRMESGVNAHANSASRSVYQPRVDNLDR